MTRKDQDPLNLVPFTHKKVKYANMHGDELNKDI